MKHQVLHKYKDCFDKIIRFPGGKYKTKRNEEAKSGIHPPRAVPVHIMPLYQAKFDKMLAESTISPVTGPTDWVNSIVCNIKEKPAARKSGCVSILKILTRKQSENTTTVEP